MSQTGQVVETLPLAVNFQKEGIEVYKGNGKSIVKHECIDCGDCVTGCNVGAKNTLYMNYLVRAGPSIVGLVRYHEMAPPRERFVIEDLSFPRAYRDAAAAAFRFLPGVPAGTQEPAQAQQRLDNDLFGADPQGALNSTMLYLCMAQDNSGGTMSLDDFGELQIKWARAGAEAIFIEVNQECLAHATALGSAFIETPSGKYHRGKHSSPHIRWVGAPWAKMGPTVQWIISGEFSRGAGPKSTRTFT